MRNKQDRQVLIIDQQKNVYIVNKIALNLNKFALIAIMQQESLVAFLAIDNASNQEQQIDQINNYTNKTNIDDFKTKTYNL